MNGFHTIDLATALSVAHRDELSHALQARPGPIRTAIGRHLVAAGHRLLGGHPDRTPVTTAGAAGY
jgi:hypothetical protein